MMAYSFHIHMNKGLMFPWCSKDLKLCSTTFCNACRRSMGWSSVRTSCCVACWLHLVSPCSFVLMDLKHPCHAMLCGLRCGMLTGGLRYRQWSEQAAAAGVVSAYGVALQACKDCSKTNVWPCHAVCAVLWNACRRTMELSSVRTSCCGVCWQHMGSLCSRSAQPTSPAAAAVRIPQPPPLLLLVQLVLSCMKLSAGMRLLPSCLGRQICVAAMAAVAATMAAMAAAPVEGSQALCK